MLYAIDDPWIRVRLETLRAELQTINSPSLRLRTLLGTYWRDIPDESGGFANNIMQAISTAEQDDLYRQILLKWMEAQLREMVLEASPKERRYLVRKAFFAHRMVMAFNGFAMQHPVNPDRPCDDESIDFFCKMLLGIGSTSAGGRLPYAR